LNLNPPDIWAIDKATYQQYRNSLTEDELLLLDKMIEAKMSNNHRGLGKYKIAFLEEKKCSYTQYQRIHLSLRKKFYDFFGFASEEEEKGFNDVLENFKSKGSMYQRMGRYIRKSKT